VAQNPFKFKQFTIYQDKCAMKIGTDGVLLGAWTSIEHNPNSILDIGTGTGVIALQLAQRSEAGLIDALEIDENAYEQAVENFESSPWNDRLFCYHISLNEFTNEVDDKYDLITSNPPFYNDDFESKSKARNTARFTSALSFESLLVSVSKLLSESGIFSVIIPFKEEIDFIALAKKYDLFVSKICRIKGSQTSAIKRSLLEFSFQKREQEINLLIIENQRHHYTAEYQDLVKDFYLKM
jgi:tRNA1Val (adenine37-N6)-methyltransferase